MMTKLSEHQLLGNQMDQLLQAIDVDSENILQFSFNSFRVWGTFHWPGRHLYWSLLSLPPITFLGLLMRQVLLLAVLL